MRSPLRRGQQRPARGRWLVAQFRPQGFAWGYPQRRLKNAHPLRKRAPPRGSAPPERAPPWGRPGRAAGRRGRRAAGTPLDRVLKAS
ncbi:Exonuclease SbcC [Actinacidiphila cocklensis]|uniref:Exonuclease SbcC n=1 Tax=Actinacidiphila cocklensis TaxID=887465 RepID=A0A9W4GNS0_9ACTN|nr:Exonuclease SbcC [Actinacidiphila cocklensis]